MKEFLHLKLHRLQKCCTAAIVLFCAGTFCAAQKTQSVVQDIVAVPTGNSSITVSWKIPIAIAGTAISALQVYRDTRPISSAAELSQLSPIAVLPSGSISYIDSPADHRDYYYAVVSRIKDTDAGDAQELYYDEDFDPPPGEDSGTLLAVVIPGMNATVTGIHISGGGETAPVAGSKKSSRGEMRRQPLPYIEMAGGRAADGSRAADGGRQITPQAEQAALELIGTRNAAGASPAKQLAPHVFAEDSVSPGGGDEYLLYEVLQKSFVQKKYSAAVSQLERFLAQNRDAAVTQRAHFYLGQAYYFCGDYPHALRQFLKVEQDYPPLAARWIDSSLDLYSPEK